MRYSSELIGHPLANALSAGLQASSAVYSSRFEDTFQLSTKGFDTPQIDFAKSLTANMIGGLGYFYGTSIVDRNFRHEYDEDDDDEDGDYTGGKREPRPEITEAKELFTATPSRSFFPRGFYW